MTSYSEIVALSVIIIIIIIVFIIVIVIFLLRHHKHTTVRVHCFKQLISPARFPQRRSSIASTVSSFLSQVQVKFIVQQRA